MLQLHAVLSSSGLTEKEAGIYLAALSLGVAPVTNLARKAGLKRPTTYLAMENLLAKGLLVAVPRGKKVWYKPESPQHIVNTITTQRSRIDAIMPELEALYLKNSRQSKIRFYEGKEKLALLYEEIFRSKEIWALVSMDSFLRVFRQDDDEHCFRILIRHGGAIHDIFEDTKNARSVAAAPYRKGVSEIRFLKKGIKTTNDILVFDANVAIVSFESVMATVIEDASVAQTMGMMLKFIWGLLAD
jgi:sugar-specific transcriptional regulator TrmB